MLRITKKETVMKNRILSLILLVMAGCAKTPPAYIQTSDGGSRAALPDTSDGGLPEAGDSGDTDTDADAGEE
jgi:hypothetical protein